MSNFQPIIEEIDGEHFIFLSAPSDFGLVWNWARERWFVTLGPSITLHSQNLPPKFQQLADWLRQVFQNSGQFRINQASLCKIIIPVFFQKPNRLGACKPGYIFAGGKILCNCGLRSCSFTRDATEEETQKHCREVEKHHNLWKESREKERLAKEKEMRLAEMMAT